MRRNIIFILLLLFCVIGIFAQKSKKTIRLLNLKTKPTSDVSLDKSKPTVFLTYEKVGDREPFNTGESRSGVWLRMHNNSIWTIWIAVQGELSESETNLRYTVEAFDLTKQTETIPLGNWRVNNSLLSPLKSGHSVLFSVPCEYLAENLGISVDFTYDWEMPSKLKSKIDEPEPRHSVLYYSKFAPKELISYCKNSQQTN